MKSFKSYIKETHHSGGISSDIPPDFHMLNKEDVKARVNTWLEGCSSMEYMTVEAALNQLANKIQLLGLTFQMSEQTFAEEGSISLNVHQYGEKHDPAGTHVLTPTIPEDLTMVVDYVKTGNGGIKISAKLS
ncbi:hypothetical protein N9159_00070 [bacterium]|jgi:hypothetical protein|nr:hypothetical protein [bacterium]|tara:strand:- start:412 stop:807 length:396 start_codon:yes stop_codon:yes gene_type:complete